MQALLMEAALEQRDVAAVPTAIITWSKAAAFVTPNKSTHCRAAGLLSQAEEKKKEKNWLSSLALGAISGLLK
jgi:hypothetical protein